MFPTTLHSFPPQPASLQPRQFEAEFPRPSSTCVEVVVALSTAISIPDYQRFYAAPLESFQPVYHSFPDGSLAAQPLLDDIKASYGLLLFIGALMMLFLRNVIVSADYIRRGRVRYKALFYVLLVSQIMGFVTFILSATTYFTNDVNCRIIVISAGVLMEISSALLLSGILGVKAYKCLDDSRWVLAIISVLQAASSSFVLADMFRLQTQRTLVGSCCIVSELRLVLLGIIARLFIALFICLCFIYALWKSSKIPAAQGRISIGLSVSNAEPLATQVGILTSNGRRPRGWWDYVAETNSRSHPAHDRPRASSWVVTEDQGFFKNMALLFRSLWSDSSSVFQKHTDASSHAKAFVPLSATQMPEKSENPGRPTTMAQAAERRMSRFTVRMHHFREVMRNELAHTAFITVTNVVAAIVGLIGVLGFRLPTSPEYFVGTNWAILSLLVVHSFGRVVVRNEREAQIQHPSAWDPIFKVQEATSSGISDSHLQRAWSSISVASNPRNRRMLYAADLDVQSPQTPEHLATTSKPPENPFEDFEPDQTDDQNAYTNESSYSTGAQKERRRDSFRYEVAEERARLDNPFLSAAHLVDQSASSTWKDRNTTFESERDSVTSENSVLEHTDDTQRLKLR